jgi:lysophospholipase L1-like esterase
VDRWSRIILAATIAIVVIAGQVVGAAAAPLLGRWQGRTKDGAGVAFLLGRTKDGETLLADSVVACPGSVAADGNGLAVETDDYYIGKDETLWRPVGRVHPDGRFDFGEELPWYEGKDLSGIPDAGYPVINKGSLRHKKGTVSRLPAPIGEEGDPACRIGDVRVHHVDRTVRADGEYTLTSSLGSTGTVDVYAGGAYARLGVDVVAPSGDPEENPSPCLSPYGTGVLKTDGGDDAFGAALNEPNAIADPNIFVGRGAFTGAGSIAGNFEGVVGLFDQVVCPFDQAFVAGAPSPSPLRPVLSFSGSAGPAPGKGPGDHGHGRHGRHRHPPKHRSRTIRYVALGDSYSSGEGVPPYVAGSDEKGDRCHRSADAYPRLLTLPGVHLEKSFFACSGATTADVLKREFEGEPPQIERPRLRGADLVTISIGGNDAGFTKVVAACTRAVPTPCFRGSRARAVQRRIAALGPRLTYTYRRVRSQAGPHSRLVVVGYPNLVPPPRQACGKLTALFSERARAFLRAEGNQLDDVIAAAARRAGVRYVDVRRQFADHEICSKQEWVNFLVRGKGATLSRASFHPNAVGQEAYAHILRAALR